MNRSTRKGWAKERTSNRGGVNNLECKNSHPGQHRLEISSLPDSVQASEPGQHQPELQDVVLAGQVPAGAVRAQPPADRAVRLLGMRSASICALIAVPRVMAANAVVMRSMMKDVLETG